MNFDELFLRIIFGAIICISYLCHHKMIITVMKKLILSIVVLLASSFSDVIAKITSETVGNEVILHVNLDDPNLHGKPIKRSPIRVPSISIDDHTLYFNSSCDGCTLRLYDEEGDLVVNLIIPDNSSTISLPSFLTGEYEIQIIRGNYCFYGYVNL